MMEHVFELREYGEHLWTREKAREVRGGLQKLLQGANPGDVIVVDAKGVEVFDFSFANELFGRTLMNIPHDHPGRFLIAENLTKYAAENLNKALESMGLIMIERKTGTGRYNLLGKVHPADKSTFSAIVRKKGPVTASALKEELEINLTAVNERLTKLTNLGVVRREKGASPAGREQYEYRAMG